jgi:hypothetical protein
MNRAAEKRQFAAEQESLGKAQIKNKVDSKTIKKEAKSINLQVNILLEKKGLI